MEGSSHLWFENPSEVLRQMTLLDCEFPQKGFLDDRITNFKSISNAIYQGKLSSLMVYRPGKQLYQRIYRHYKSHFSPTEKLFKQ